MGLVLTRKLGERVWIDDNIVVTILEERRAGQVRLHITAPSNIKIWREELTHVCGVGGDGGDCRSLYRHHRSDGLGDSGDGARDKHVLLAVSLLCLAALECRDPGGYCDALNQIGNLLDARG